MIHYLVMYEGELYDGPFRSQVEVKTCIGEFERLYHRTPEVVPTDLGKIVHGTGMKRWNFTGRGRPNVFKKRKT